MTTETVLTDEEITKHFLSTPLDDYRMFARAIEQAVLQSNSEAIRALLDERDVLREALEIARDFVAEALAQERDAYRGYESVSGIAAIECYLSQIDAAMKQQK